MFGVPLLPVMVRLHGGGFTTGSGNVETSGPDFIVQERVVLVTMNYRLSMFGSYLVHQSNTALVHNVGFIHAGLSFLFSFLINIIFL